MALVRLICLGFLKVLAPHLLPIYLISKMHAKTIQQIQKAYIKTYEEDVKIYKDIENSQGQGAFFFANTGNG